MAEELQEVQTISAQDALKAAFFPDETTVTEVPVETPAEVVDPVVEVEAAQEPVITPEPATTPAVEEAPKPSAFDPIAFIKETFGDEYQDIETVKAKLSAPAPEPVYKEPEFANEESKKLYNSLLAGDKSVLRDYLRKEELVDYVETKAKSPEEIIKLGLKEEYDLTDAQAQKKFDKMFSIPDIELLDEDEKEIEQKILNKKIQREADNYKAFFSKYKQEITLPALVQQAPASAPIPEESEEAKKAYSFATELNKSLPNDLSKFEYEFADENSGLKIKGQIPIPEKDLSQIKSQLQGHEDKYLAARWFDKDNNPKQTLIDRDIYVLQNLPTIIKAAVSDAVQQTKLKVLAENKNRSTQEAKVVPGNFTPDEQAAAIAEFEKYWGVPAKR
jgi:hypothetical protein